MKIFAIELTNYCNARCSFCPYPTPAHTREKGMMQSEVLYRIINHISEPKAINISGLGEPTLHPQLVDMIQLLTNNGIKTQLNTNGKKLNQQLYDQLVMAGLHNIILTSDYFPWDKGKINVSDACPITFFTITREPDHPEYGQTRKPLDDWAKQIGDANRPKVRSFLFDNFVQICWDGTIQRCCCDFNANEPLGNILNDEDVVRVTSGITKKQPISLCGGCSGYVFENGIVAGDYQGKGEKAPDAFVQLDTGNQNEL